MKCRVLQTAWYGRRLLEPGDLFDAPDDFKAPWAEVVEKPAKAEAKTKAKAEPKSKAEVKPKQGSPEAAQVQPKEKSEATKFF